VKIEGRKVVFIRRVLHLLIAQQTEHISNPKESKGLTSAQIRDRMLERGWGKVMPHYNSLGSALSKSKYVRKTVEKYGSKSYIVWVANIGEENGDHSSQRD